VCLCNYDITPEAFEGGTIAVVENGDSITIDAQLRQITLNISDEEIAKRKANWSKPEPKYTRGLLAKYAKTVSSASTGAVTDKPEQIMDQYVSFIKLTY